VIDSPPSADAPGVSWRGKPVELVSVIVGHRIKDLASRVLVSVAGPIIPILTVRQEYSDNTQLPCDGQPFSTFAQN